MVYLKSYNFDKEHYEHGLCHYFAIELAKLYKCPIHFWLDEYDFNDGNDFATTVLCHTYLEIAKGIYLDAYGVFTDISECEDDFEYNTEKPIIHICNNLDDAYNLLKTLKITYTNIEHKRNAREFLHNNILTLGVRYNNINYALALKGYSENREVYLISQYNKNSGEVSKRVSGLSKKDISFGYLGNYDFVTCERWYYKI